MNSRLRYLPIGVVVAGFLASLAVSLATGCWLLATAALGALTAVGVFDLLQPRSTLRRIYPLLGHMRHFLESIGPEFRQYFIESDSDEVPFSREQRSVMYQRAKGELDKKPFGTLKDVYALDYEWISPSLAPTTIDDHDFRIHVGEGRAQPYSASVFNISAMSYGAISPNAIRALNEGARRGHFFHDTGEGSVSPFHRERGGDLVWNIGSGYFGCRDLDGRFSEERFGESSKLPQVRMIEVKLSQGAKPGHGGVLEPGRAAVFRGSTARPVRRQADGLQARDRPPLGVLQYCQGHDRDRRGAGLHRRRRRRGRDRRSTARVRQSRRRAVARGADAGSQHARRHRRARSRADRCGRQGHDRFRHRPDDCPRRGLVQCGAWLQVRAWLHPVDVLPYGSPPDGNCHAGSAKLAAAGLTHPRELGPEHVIHRVSATEISSLGRLYPFLEPRQLLDGRLEDVRHVLFRTFWSDARPDSFDPPARIAALRESKLG